MSPTLPQIISGVPKLASYSGVLRELDEVLSDPQSTVTDVCGVFENDPALVAKLLKLGNSSYFAFSHRVETVFETISLIGIQQTRDLIAAATVMKVFEGVSSIHVNMESFWKHSLACGVAGRLLAMGLFLEKPESFFTGGLLHDIGRLVLLTRLPDKAREIFEVYGESRQLLRDVEKRFLGYDHAEIGASLLQFWNYPGNLIHAVEYHHAAMVSSAFQMEACVVHVADHLVNAMELGCGGERLIPPLDRRAWDRLGLATDALGSVVESIDAQVAAVEEVFLATHKGA